MFARWSVEGHVTSKWVKTPGLRIAVSENPFPKVHPRHSGGEVSFRWVCVSEWTGPAYSLSPFMTKKRDGGRGRETGNREGETRRDEERKQRSSKLQRLVLSRGKVGVFKISSRYTLSRHQVS